MQSVAPFAHWHKESAAYQAGGVLQTEGDAIVQENSVAMRPLGTLTGDNGIIVRYYVGTKKDGDAWDSLHR